MEWSLLFSLALDKQLSAITEETGRKELMNEVVMRGAIGGGAFPRRQDLQK